MKLLLATTNRGKLDELRALTAALPVEIIGLAELSPLPEVLEDGATFAANAQKKAEAAALATGLPTLADDSGLAVEALGGAPGVLSARYAGLPRSDARNNERLLADLAGVAARAASFHCALALAAPGQATIVAHGELRGTIGLEPRGMHGFGYDPLFIVDGQSATLAELASDEKNRLSHRAHALRRMLPHIEALAADPRFKYARTSGA